MGYQTYFTGQFKLDKPLLPEHAQYLAAFSSTRRMKRDAGVAERLADPVRVQAGLPIGPQAAYFVGGGGLFGQDRDASIIDYNEPPTGQPGLWCNWEPIKDGTAIEWSGTEKFYNYVEWMQYLIDNFLSRWGYTVNGEVEWEGEEQGDIGKIIVTNNEVTTKIKT